MSWLVSIPPTLMSLTTAGILLPSLGSYIEVFTIIIICIQQLLQGLAGDCSESGHGQVH